VNNVPVITADTLPVAAASGSIMPFCSGSGLSSIFPVNNVFLGFGAQNNATTDYPITFMVPADGTLSNLTAYMNISYVDGVSDTFAVNFVLLNDTAQQAISTPISIIYSGTSSTNESGVTFAPLAVSAGDQVELYVNVTSSIPRSLTFVNSLSAGVLFTPSP